MQQTNPFLPQHYSSYRQAFSDLGRQGLPALYKGNLLGLLHNLLVTQMRFLVYIQLQNGVLKQYVETPEKLMAANFGLITLGEMLLHPLHNLQSRFILQKRYPNYRVYSGILDAFKRHRKELGRLYQGFSVILPINLLKAGSMSITAKDPFSFGGLVIAAHILTYPLLTIQRRTEVVDPKIDGMLKGSSSSLKNIANILNSEGVRGLYRGFLGHSILVDNNLTKQSMSLATVLYLSTNSYLEVQ